MSGVVERVARALARRHYVVRFGLSPDHPQVQMNVDGSWQIFADDAVTSIEAMREPSEEMLAAAVPYPASLVIERNDDEYTRNMKVATTIERLAMRSRYQTMIDTALGATP